MSILEIAVCRTRPTVTEMGDLYMVAYQRDATLTAMVAEQTWKSCEQTGKQISHFIEKRFELEWKLPENYDEVSDDPKKRVIEYLGVPTRYSKTRYGIMKAIILAKGKRVSYDVVSMAGWGAIIDKEVLEYAVYHLNNFLASIGIHKFIHCDKDEVYMDSNFPPNSRRGKPNKK